MLRITGGAIKLGGAFKKFAGEPDPAPNPFTTGLYEGTRTGTSSSVSIDAGLDILGSGGLYIGKRLTTSNWGIVDTNRGTELSISTSVNTGTGVEVTVSDMIDSFDSNGITIGPGNSFNSSGSPNLDLLFLQEAGFLDIVSFTGNGTSQAVPHNLGTEVGHLSIKSRSTVNGWGTWHRGFTSTQVVNWNTANAVSTSSLIWNNTLPDSSNFYVGGNGGVNVSGGQQIAYVFAHNPAKGIYCGSYTGSGAAGNKQTIGFKPKFLLIKPTSVSAGWVVQTAGLNSSNGDNWSSYVILNSNQAQSNLGSATIVEADGFSFGGTSNNQSSTSFSYIAIGDV